MSKSTKFWRILSLLAICTLISFFIYKGVMGLGYYQDWTLIYSFFGYVAFGIALIIGGGLFQYLATSEQVTEYVEEVISEMKKVVWPQKKEVKVSTVAVIILTIVCSIILALFDSAWSLTLQTIFSVAEEIL